MMIAVGWPLILVLLGSKEVLGDQMLCQGGDQSANASFDYNAVLHQCIDVQTELLGFDDHATKCSARGGYLAVPYGPSENFDFYNLVFLEIQVNGRVFLGAKWDHDQYSPIKTTPQWIYRNLKPRNGSSVPGVDEGPIDGEGDCLAIDLLSEDPTYFWIRVNCTDKYSAICFQTLPAIVQTTTPTTTSSTTPTTPTATLTTSTTFSTTSCPTPAGCKCPELVETRRCVRSKRCPTDDPDGYPWCRYYGVDGKLICLLLVEETTLQIEAYRKCKAIDAGLVDLQYPEDKKVLQAIAERDCIGYIPNESGIWLDYGHNTTSGQTIGSVDEETMGRSDVFPMKIIDGPSCEPTNDTLVYVYPRAIAKTDSYFCTRAPSD